MAQGPASGWENPDGHKGIEKRARPMFDTAGNAVDSAPPAEDLTPAERAMFAAVEAGADQATAVATGVIVGESGPEMIDPEMIGRLRRARDSRIRELATTALDNPMPAAWALALGEILRELES